MRTLLLATALVFAGSAAVVAADAPAAAAPAAVNKICPATGKAANDKFTFTVKVDGKDVVVAAHDEATLKAAQGMKPEEQVLLAKAALEGKIVKDGKIVDAAK